jgi:uncharacterized protein YjbI with pentapeptide repeats
MANPEHVAILEQGVEAWNEWRRKNLNTLPDLTGANFTRADLRGVDLAGAHLEGVHLTGANLAGADIMEADLRGADLTRANFTRADLGEADLRGADLMGAKLGWANLGEADFRGANLGGVILLRTVIGATDLSGAVGLDTCKHFGPSILDHRTLELSGPLPLAFLRGCGLPDALIEYLPSLLNQPIQFYACFISYSAKDQAFAERLHADLQNKGVRCWFAPEDLKIGDKTRERIDESIRVYDKLLLILSEHSMASQWVEQEVETALRKERDPKGNHRTVLFPIRLDDAVMKVEGGWPALIRNTRNIGDFSEWKDHDSYQKAFARLLRDLKAGSKPPASDVS